MRPFPRRVLIIGAVASMGAAATLPAFAATPQTAPVPVAKAQGTPAPGRYIVTLKTGVSPATTAKRARATSVQRFGNALNGFAAKLSTSQLDTLRRDPSVAAIEQDQIVKASTTQRSPLPWGLDRIDQRGKKLSKTYTYKMTGTGVNAYVIDSGLAHTHPEFGGRASIAWVGPEFNGDGWDHNGHGTHVAGTIGSKLYGVAKNVNVRGMRVLDADGYGYMSTIIAAVDWLRTNAKKPAVANLSLGGGKSTALNAAVEQLSRTGVFTSVAAGNENQNACNTSPASAGWVMAVGATTVYDNRAAFSNYGKCVDIFAPGYGVYSTWPGGGRAKISGTSMAAPHVSGAAALYLQGHKTSTFPQVQKWLNDYSTKGQIGRLPSGTANRLLYKGGL
ncbi:S8 family peptidase [Actinomadura sp. 9N407]|uniref:S8 family peptidase n=1 Tax=Actinomadura sp. 9N407 TaxID=3375154 RepID=UPI00378B9305